MPCRGISFLRQAIDLLRLFDANESRFRLEQSVNRMEDEILDDAGGGGG